MSDKVNTCVEILRKAARTSASFDCRYCPVYNTCPTGTAGWNNECIFETAADLIKSLSAELEQVKAKRDGLNVMLGQARSMLETRTRERDAALEFIARDCDYCKHRPKKYWHDYSMNEFCVECCTNDYCHWQWRGVQEHGVGADNETR